MIPRVILNDGTDGVERKYRSYRYIGYWCNSSLYHRGQWTFRTLMSFWPFLVFFDFLRFWPFFQQFIFSYFLQKNFRLQFNFQNFESKINFQATSRFFMLNNRLQYFSFLWTNETFVDAKKFVAQENHQVAHRKATQNSWFLKLAFKFTSSSLDIVRMNDSIKSYQTKANNSALFIDSKWILF